LRLDCGGNLFPRYHRGYGQGNPDQGKTYGTANGQPAISAFVCCRQRFLFAILSSFHIKSIDNTNKGNVAAHKRTAQAHQLMSKNISRATGIIIFAA
jgi:hypothetical protein